MADESSISPESVAFLGEARKGKARRFVMICKGVQIVSLVVYKKGGLEKYKKEAKQSGKGTICFGVVDGQGENITFRLARADGFEEPPVKTNILRAFLKEEADFKCKPDFEIVDVIQPVLDPDDPLVVRFLKARELAQATAAVQPAHAAELTKACDETARLLEEDDRGAAEAQLRALIGLLSTLRGAPPTPVGGQGTEPPPAGPATATAELKVKLGEALKKLRPLLDQAVLAQPQRKGELVQSMAQVVGEIKAEQFDAARGNIVALGKLLQSLIAQGGPAGGARQQADFEARRAKVEPKLRADQTAFPDKSAALQKLWDYAAAQAQAGNYPNALKALERLEQPLTPASTTPPDSDVLGIWRDAKDQTDAQLNGLASTLRKSRHPYLQRVGELGLQGLTLDPSRVFVNMQAALFDYQNAATDKRQTARSRVLDAIQTYRSFLQSNRLLEVFDTDAYCGPLTIRKTLLDALSQVERAVNRSAS